MFEWGKLTLNSAVAPQLIRNLSLVYHVTVSPQLASDFGVCAGCNDNITLCVGVILLVHLVWLIMFYTGSINPLSNPLLPNMFGLKS